MKSIVLMGAGQLGSRHLQALVKLRQPYRIVIVDPSDEAIKVAKQRCEEIEMAAKHEISYCDSLLNCGFYAFNYAILSTNAKYRFHAFLQLMEYTTVEYIIFEKVLFQSLNEYKNTAIILAERNVKAWVNCPLRVYPFYQDIKFKYFKKGLPYQYAYSAGEWSGLACNSIHYLDHLNFFSQSFPDWIDFTELDKDLLHSKRKGFIEFTGKIISKFRDGSQCVIDVKKGSEATSFITISQAETKLVVEELTGSYEIIVSDKIIEQGKFPPIYQSNLTNQYIRDLEDSGACQLTPYSDSMKLHLPFIKGLLTHYESSSQMKSEYLPIT